MLSEEEDEEEDEEEENHGTFHAREPPCSPPSDSSGTRTPNRGVFRVRLLQNKGTQGKTKLSWSCRPGREWQRGGTTRVAAA